MEQQQQQQQRRFIILYDIVHRECNTTAAGSSHGPFEWTNRYNKKYTIYKNVPIIAVVKARMILGPVLTAHYEKHSMWRGRVTRPGTKFVFRISITGTTPYNILQTIGHRHNMHTHTYRV